MWFFNNGPLPDNVLQKKSTIEIRAVKKRNKGVYECIGKNKYSPYALFSASVTLHVKSKLYKLYW